MSWKCDNCGQKLKGFEKYCPVCATPKTYYCVKCGKEMMHGKSKYCPMCKAEKAEIKKENFKKAGEVVLGVAVFVGVVQQKL